MLLTVVLGLFITISHAPAMFWFYDGADRTTPFLLVATIQMTHFKFYLGLSQTRPTQD